MNNKREKSAKAGAGLYSVLSARVFGAMLGAAEEGTAGMKTLRAGIV